MFQPRFICTVHITSYLACNVLPILPVIPAISVITVLQFTSGRGYYFYWSYYELIILLCLSYLLHLLIRCKFLVHNNKYLCLVMVKLCNKYGELVQRIDTISHGEMVKYSSVDILFEKG